MDAGSQDELRELSGFHRIRVRARSRGFEIRSMDQLPEIHLRILAKNVQDADEIAHDFPGRQKILRAQPLYGLLHECLKVLGREAIFNLVVSRVNVDKPCQQHEDLFMAQCLEPYDRPGSVSQAVPCKPAFGEAGAQGFIAVEASPLVFHELENPSNEKAKIFRFSLHDVIEKGKELFVVAFP